MEKENTSFPGLWINAKKSRVLSIFVCLSFAIASSFVKSGKIPADFGLGFWGELGLTWEVSFWLFGLPYLMFAWLGSRKAVEYKVPRKSLIVQYGIGIIILLSILNMPSLAQ